MSQPMQSIDLTGKIDITKLPESHVNTYYVMYINHEGFVRGRSYSMGLTDEFTKARLYATSDSGFQSITSLVRNKKAPPEHVVAFPVHYILDPHELLTLHIKEPITLQNIHKFKSTFTPQDAANVKQGVVAYINQRGFIRDRGDKMKLVPDFSSARVYSHISHLTQSVVNFVEHNGFEYRDILPVPVAFVIDPQHLFSMTIGFDISDSYQYTFAQFLAEQQAYRVKREAKLAEKEKSRIAYNQSKLAEKKAMIGKPPQENN